VPRSCSRRRSPPCRSSTRRRLRRVCDRGRCFGRASGSDAAFGMDVYTRHVGPMTERVNML
jgi:hypothetical protein